MCSRRTWPASFARSCRSPAAAARLYASSGIDDHRKQLKRPAISQSVSGRSAGSVAGSIRYRNAGDTRMRASVAF